MATPPPVGGIKTGAVPSGNDPPARVTPDLTVPQYLSVGAFLLFLVLAIVADASDPEATLNGVEYDKLRDMTLFLIAALLPSDALLRFGRSILFSKVEDAEAAQYAPATTRAQKLAVVVYLGAVAAMLFANNIVTAGEGDQVVEVAQVLIVALLPSDAGIRFGRALRLSRRPELITQAQLKRV